MKSIRLNELKKLNYSIPEFIVVNETKDKRLKSFFNKHKTCIVRSDSVIEDKRSFSQAGVFPSIVVFDYNHLVKSLKLVLSEAKQAIVQKFIDSDLSGVLFTRNPIGQREMIIEYDKGSQQITNSSNNKKRIALYWSEDPEFLSMVFQKLVSKAKAIEKIFNFPQDIEWLIKKNKLYFLQSRDITSINSEKYEEFLQLEEFLKDLSVPYFLEKNDFTASAPRPKPISFSLLQKIFAEQGPCDLIYQKHNIKYVNKFSLFLIGNELYQDKQKELQSVFPSFFLKSDGKKIRLVFKNWFATLSNLWCLLNLKKISLSDLYEEILNKLLAQHTHSSFKEQLNHFFDTYQLIFLSSLVVSLKKTNRNNKMKDFNLSKVDSIDFSNFIGNSILIEDESKFIPLNLKNQEISSLEIIKELARWLLIKETSALRRFLSKEDYFYTIDEIIFQNKNKALSRIRRKKYSLFQKYSFPKIITHNYSKNDKKNLPLTISSGNIVGLVITKEDLTKGASGILITDHLSLDLLPFIDRIKGVISLEGNLLSHFAIHARERNIPVLSNYQINKIKKGQKVSLESDKRVVRILS